MAAKTKVTEEIPNERFWTKLRKYAKRAGAKVVYASLLMFYAFKKKETPKWAKTAILGALAYFLSPIDFIPDLTPLFGFTDDLSVLLTGLITIGTYIDADIKSKAKAKMEQWFDEDSTLKAIEKIGEKLARKKK